MLKYIIVLIIFLLMNLLIIGIGQVHEPFHAAFSIAIPFHGETIVISILIFNYSIIMIFILFMMNRLNQIISMTAYILPRSNRKRLFRMLILRTFKLTFLLIIIKFLADIVTGQIDGMVNVTQFLMLYSSLIVTVFIWLALLVVMQSLNIGERVSIFIVLIVLFVCQYLSINIEWVNVLVVASPTILENFFMWFIVKILVLVILMIIAYYSFTNKEFLGDVKE